MFALSYRFIQELYQKNEADLIKKNKTARVQLQPKNYKPNLEDHHDRREGKKIKVNTVTGNGRN